MSEDIAALHALILALTVERDALTIERDGLLAHNDPLSHLLLKLKRMQFGAHAERLPEEQLQLGFEALEQAIARGNAEAEKGLPKVAKALAAKRCASRGAGAPAPERGKADTRRHYLPVLPPDDDGDRRG